ncbi:MAG: deoxynucleoside kinase [Anaerolineales bacterium]|nr:deoxynucleoside kinase [Anaerolineales bacterium]
MKRFVIVAGNIGVGKSSLVNLLCQRLNWQPFYEVVVENPYLADFYHDMHRWGFHSQVFFLSNRLHTHRQITEHPASVIQDRSVYEDAEIFAHNLYAQGQMSARDYATYRRLYEGVIECLPAPDLVLYLRASVDTLLTRVARRGRDYEAGIAPDYLTRLNELYARWIDSFHLCPVLTIPADALDFVAHSTHLELIARKMTEMLEGRAEVVFSDAEMRQAAGL